MFKKATALSGHMFKKGAPALSSISKNLGSAAKIAQKVASVGKEALQSDLAKNIIAANPELQKGSKLLNKGLDVASKASGVLSQASNLTNASTYKGSQEQVAKDAIQRAKNIAQSAGHLNFV